MIRKEIKFSNELAEAIQEYADKHYEGNFNMAARNLTDTSLKLIKDKSNGEPTTKQ